MYIVINWWAISIATIVGTMLAGVWYSTLFGSEWRKLTGVTAADSKRAGSRPMIILVLANFLTAIGLGSAISLASSYFDNHSFTMALLIGVITWFCFSASTLVTHNAFELKPSKLTRINLMYQLVLFTAMAAIINVISS